MVRSLGNGPLHERDVWILWSSINIDERCDKSPADNTFLSVGLKDSEREGSPINRKIFMAVRRKWMRIKDTSTSILFLLTKHASLPSVPVRLPLGGRSSLSAHPTPILQASISLFLPLL